MSVASAVTAIAFHFNMPDKLAYACRLLRKASRAGAQVGVVGRDTDLAALDRALWVFDPVDFLPHVRLPLPEGEAGRRLASHTRLWLASSPTELPHREVLVNLGDEVPASFDAFGRLIELVGLDEDDRRQARLRWKHYQSCGYAVERHEVGGG